MTYHIRTAEVSVSYTLERDNGSWWDLAIPCTLTGEHEPMTRHHPGCEPEVEVWLDRFTIDGGSTTERPVLTPNESTAIEDYCLGVAVDQAADEYESDRAEHMADRWEERRWA